MSDKPLALSTVLPAEPAEPDYDAICQAVMSTTRGRWFLHEYAKRNRNADTSQVLAAIERIEAAFASERQHHAGQEVRIELLEMARAIAQTRAEVAESLPVRGTSDPGVAHTLGEPGIAGAAERLRDIAWTMRACGVELRTSEQIEQIAETILAASSLHDPADHRAQKLSEVLGYLEHRIDRMLDSHLHAAMPPVADDAPEPEAPPQQTDRLDAADDAQPTAASAVAPAAVAASEGVASPLPEIASEADVASELPAAEQFAPEPLSQTIEALDTAAVEPEASPAPVAETVIELATEPILDAAIKAGPQPILEADAKAPPSGVDMHVGELRIERVELELEPLVIVSAGPPPADSGDHAPPAFEPWPVAELAVDDGAPPSTGDSALDAVLGAPDAPAEPTPGAGDPVIDADERATAPAALDVEPLVAVTDAMSEPEPEPEPQSDTQVEVALAGWDVPAPMIPPAPPSTVDHALDEELAVPREPVAVQVHESVVEIIDWHAPASMAQHDEPSAESPPAVAIEWAVSEMAAQEPQPIEPAVALELAPQAIAAAPEAEALAAPETAPEIATDAAVVREPEPATGAPEPEPATTAHVETAVPQAPEAALAAPEAEAPDALTEPPVAAEPEVLAAEAPASQVETSDERPGEPALPSPAADPVTAQVDQDLQVLTELFADASALPDRPDGAAAAPPPPPESDVLADAWQTAIRKPSVLPERDGARPVPSMWEQPVRPTTVRDETAHNEDPAEFLLEPVVSMQPAANAAPAAADAELEHELFAVAPDAATPAPQPATEAVSAPPAPRPPAPTAPAQASVTSPRPMPRHVADDPLAALTAMTPEERIALFT